MADGCPFCERLAAGEVVGGDDVVAVLQDAFPLTDGHALVVPRRHVGRVGELTEAEWTHLHAIGRQVTLAAGGDGVTYGINDGAAAGQTVGHLHLHVVPRRHGDVADPRGGIRCVVSERARYWEGT